jgi:FAD/FMN-containing dehydrogenase
MATAVTLAGIDEFRAQIRGEVITPADTAYEEARKLHNAMIDKRPAVIARCRDVADVQAALAFGKSNELDIAVRGAGHNGAGLGSVEGGTVIDLSLMRWVRVDPGARTAQIGGGCMLADIDHATHAFGLAAPIGILGTTGVGLLLGGGVGHLTRKYGLSIDNILGADVVLADGSFARASEDENADLYWAIRGGGGNFGVVTSLTVRLHEVSNVIAGPILWPLDQAAEILAWYREFLPAQPDELTGFFAFLTVPPGPPFPEELHLQKMCGVVWCIDGDAAHADELLQPARAVGNPALDGVAEVPLPAWNAAFDELYPHGDQWYWRSAYVKEIPDAAIERHVEFGKAMPTWKSTMHLYPSDGAAARVGPDATPWAYRDATWTTVYAGVDPDPANAEALRRWAVDYSDALHPYTLGGGYVNMMMDEGQEPVQATYASNYARLAEIKAKYDPDNVFHVNQNIRPA